MKYLKLPIDLSTIAGGKKPETLPIEASIAQNLMMLVTCRYGEIAGRPDFGSEIWELEFNQLVKIHEWEEKVKNSLIVAVAKYEKRLKDIEIFVSLTEIENELHHRDHKEIKRKADIFIKGEIVYVETPFQFNTTVFISPLSQ
ncbi:MAG: GPW/gp25 family protein [Flavobacteriaceae bacterium]|nr:GPW/gp25 family protein [Flavobacteriaceae bacterium]